VVLHAGPPPRRGRGQRHGRRGARRRGLGEARREEELGGGEEEVDGVAELLLGVAAEDDDMVARRGTMSRWRRGLAERSGDVGLGGGRARRGVLEMVDAEALPWWAGGSGLGGTARRGELLGGVVE
jgi:hypothetical protein